MEIGEPNPISPAPYLRSRLRYRKVAAGADSSDPLEHDEVRHVAHHVGQLVVLRRVDGGHAELLQLGLVALGDDAADDYRRGDALLVQQAEDLGHELEVTTREDRDADQVDVLIPRRSSDLGRCEANPLVDHFETSVA